METITFEDSGAISLKDTMQGNSTVEPIQKEESSNVKCPFTNPTQTKATSKDNSEKGNNSGAFYTVNSKCSEIAGNRDCINVEKIDNADNTWRLICKNIGMVEDVTPDGNCGYHSCIGACNHTTRKFGVDLPQMRSTKLFLLNMQKDLKQWCHENYHLFIEGNGKQDKISSDCGEDVNNMFYGPLFEFCSILEDPSNTSSILELFDNVVGKEIYNKDIEYSDWFPIKDDAIRHVPFLAYQYETSFICYGVPCDEDDQRAVCTTTHTWYNLELKKVNTDSIDGFTILPPGVPCIIHYIEPFQYINTRKNKKQVCFHSRRSSLCKCKKQ